MTDQEEGSCVCSPRMFLALSAVFLFVQTATVGGVFNAGISTLERRYSLTSLEAGILASTYDLGVLLVSFFIGYLGTYGHRPRIMGIGMFVFAIGCFVFGLPHFVAGKYDFSDTSQADLCGDGTQPDQMCNNESSLAYGLLLAGILLVAFGSAPLFTLAPAHLDWILPQSSLASYLGVLYLFGGLGPAAGFVAASFSLREWVEYGDEPDNIDSDDTNWVGAWWIPWYFACGLAILFSFPFCCFSRGERHPDNGDPLDKNEHESHQVKEYNFNNKPPAPKVVVVNKHTIGGFEAQMILQDIEHKRNPHLHPPGHTLVPPSHHQRQQPQHHHDDSGPAKNFYRPSNSRNHDHPNNNAHPVSIGDPSHTHAFPDPGMTHHGASPTPNYDEKRKGHDDHGVPREESSYRDALPTALSCGQMCRLGKSVCGNAAFMFVSLGLAAEAFAIAGLATFIVKIVETSFDLSAADASLYVGVTVILGAAGGLLFGGLLSGCCLHLTPRKNALMIFIVSIISLPLMGGFLLGCDETPLAGVFVRYNPNNNNNEIVDSGLSLDSQCNQGCDCARYPYYPVCANGINYFSPCYAGCTTRIDGETFGNCVCAASNPSSATELMDLTAKEGKCDSNCDYTNLIYFFLILFFIMFTTLANAAPASVVTLKSIPRVEKSVGQGMQQIIVRLLGAIPGPIVFGIVIDDSCALREERCGYDNGSCYEYRGDDLRMNILILAAAPKLVAIICYFIAWRVFPTHDDDHIHQIEMEEVKSEPKAPQGGAQKLRRPKLGPSST